MLIVTANSDNTVISFRDLRVSPFYHEVNSFTWCLTNIWNWLKSFAVYSFNLFHAWRSVWFGIAKLSSLIESSIKIWWLWKPFWFTFIQLLYLFWQVLIFFKCNVYSRKNALRLNRNKIMFKLKKTISWRHVIITVTISSY